MKRSLFKLVVFLLLGAVVNIAVAWGCAVRPYPRGLFSSRVLPWPSRDYQWTSPEGFDTYIVERTGEWRVSQDRMIGFVCRLGPPPQRLNDSQYRDLIPEWSAFAEPRVGARLNADMFVEQANGWPLLCLRLDGPLFSGNDLASLYSEMSGGLELPWIAPPWRNVVPYHPIWSGFTINTILYAPFLWLLSLGPFAARRMIRRKRGHCIKCGYNLRGDFSCGCPECGWRREEKDAEQPA